MKNLLSPKFPFLWSYVDVIIYCVRGTPTIFEKMIWIHKQRAFFNSIFSENFEVEFFLFEKFTEKTIRMHTFNIYWNPVITYTNKPYSNHPFITKYDMLHRLTNITIDQENFCGEPLNDIIGWSLETTVD